MLQLEVENLYYLILNLLLYTTFLHSYNLKLRNFSLLYSNVDTIHHILISTLFLRLCYCQQCLNNLKYEST